MNDIVKQDQAQYEIMEKVIAEGDLSKLSPQERMTYYNNTCKSLGLNPLTQPFAYIRLNGKLALYARKDATEQLRKINKISVYKLDTKTIEGVYVVTAYAKTPEGQEDISTGAVTIKGLQGENLANAFLKAETKAKRRVTLSICGLGLLDDSEVDSIKGHERIDHKALEQAHNQQTGEIETTFADHNSFMDYMSLIENAKDMTILQDLFCRSTKKFKSNKHFIEKLIKAKDVTKERLETELADMMDLERSPLEPIQEEVKVETVTE